MKFLLVFCVTLLSLSAFAESNNELHELWQHIDFDNPTTDPEFIEAKRVANVANMMKKNEYGVPAWQYYATNFPQIVPTFMERGLDPNALNKQGGSVAYSIVMSKNAEIAHELSNILYFTESDEALLKEKIEESKETIRKGMAELGFHDDNMMKPFCDVVKGREGLPFAVSMAQLECESIPAYERVSQIFIDARSANGGNGATGVSQ